MFWLECGQARVNGRGKGRYDVTQDRETVLTRVKNSNADRVARYQVFYPILTRYASP